jgi:NADH dehydrogenase FAD-containing subunit
MPPNTKTIILGALKEQNVEFINQKELEKVEPNSLHFKDGSDPLAFDVLWGVWPIRAPDFVQESGLPINPKGTITVEDKVTNTIANAPGAHIIGDACRVPFGQAAGVPKAGEFAWKMGISVADAICGNRQPADRSGRCTAETGFGKGIILSPNFSDVCNSPENGKPKVGIEKADDGTFQKVAWCNGYLKDIFGDNVKPVVLKD